MSYSYLHARTCGLKIARVRVFARVWACSRKCVEDGWVGCAVLSCVGELRESYGAQ